MSSLAIAVTGGTGYIGRALLPVLVARGHQVTALVRRGSEGRIPTGVIAVEGNALDASDVARVIDDATALVHLVGVPKPSPAKARQFREIDLVSVRAAVEAACVTRPHLVYLSVAQPAPVMREYVAVRTEAEALIRRSGLSATFLRPWYVIGPGHRWPLALLPVYGLMRLFPGKRESAQRLGLVTLAQIVTAIVQAVENPLPGVRIVDVPAIRRAAIVGTRQ